MKTKPIGHGGEVLGDPFVLDFQGEHILRRLMQALRWCPDSYREELLFVIERDRPPAAGHEPKVEASRPSTLRITRIDFEKETVLRQVTEVLRFTPTPFCEALLRRLRKVDTESLV